MYCKFCGNHMEDNSIICGRCGSDIDPNDGGQSFYDDEELNEWRESSSLPEIRTIMPTAEISQDDDFEDEIDERLRRETTTIVRSGKTSVSKRKTSNKKNSKKGTDIYIIIGLCVLIAVMVISLAVFIFINKENENKVDSNEETTSEISESGETLPAENSENPENVSETINIPNDKDITRVCSVSDKNIYVFGEKIVLKNKNGDKIN
ncbi:MAG: hypothetical protein LUH47_01585 [Clostridiales bacterium]|nr:hypothetical protein [Clostridiales bacterium]